MVLRFSVFRRVLSYYYRRRRQRTSDSERATTFAGLCSRESGNWLPNTGAEN